MTLINFQLKNGESVLKKTNKYLITIGILIVIIAIGGAYIVGINSAKTSNVKTEKVTPKNNKKDKEENSKVVSKKNSNASSKDKQGNTAQNSANNQSSNNSQETNNQSSNNNQGTMDTSGDDDVNVPYMDTSGDDDPHVYVPYSQLPEVTKEAIDFNNKNGLSDDWSKWDGKVVNGQTKMQNYKTGETKWVPANQNN